MHYSQIIKWLYEQLPCYQREGQSAYKKDINNIKHFFHIHGNDHLLFKSIHVAGTNGKGSVSHMLSSIFQSAGYRVGIFTSPHLLDFRERIKINNKMISKKFIIDFLETHKESFKKMQMSFFEMNVAMAFRYFVYKKVDIAIVEVGLGGRLDATNIIQPELSIITNISMDHANLLGDSIELIAKEKAGVIKNNIPILLGEKNTYSQILEKIALNRNAPVFYPEKYNYYTDLKGEYQNDNINTSVEAISILNNQGYQIHEEHIISGLKNVFLNTGLIGRWQIIKQNPTVICDIAHNIDAIKLVFNQLEKSKFKKHVIIGFSRDKKIDAIVSSLPKTIKYYICSSSNPRIMRQNELKIVFEKFNLDYKYYSNAHIAYNDVVKKTDKNTIVLITGSTFIVSDVLKYLDKV